MKLKDYLKFEPVNLTQIIITLGMALLIIMAFRSQLDGFFSTLKDRPISVKMSGDSTSIQLDAPVQANMVARSVSNPQGSEDDLQHWEQTVQDINSISDFQKLGFNELYEKLSEVTGNQFAVINFEVNDPSRHYLQDNSMLKYLSIAADKVRYLAFYQQQTFVAAIEIQAVISGLAASKSDFMDFGAKVKSGQWQQFPGLLRHEHSFEHPPSIQELYTHLTTHNVTEVPLVKAGKLSGFLNYRSISSALYAQAQGSNAPR